MVRIATDALDVVRTTASRTHVQLNPTNLARRFTMATRTTSRMISDSLNIQTFLTRPIACRHFACVLKLHRQVDTFRLNAGSDVTVDLPQSRPGRRQFGWLEVRIVRVVAGVGRLFQVLGELVHTDVRPLLERFELVQTARNRPGEACVKYGNLPVILLDFFFYLSTKV